MSETATNANASPGNSGPDPKKEAEVVTNANASSSNSDLDPKKEAEVVTNANASSSNSDPESDQKFEPPTNANASPNNSGPESDEARQPSKGKPLGLMYCISVEEAGDTVNRWFYSAKRFPGLKDYFAEKDDHPVSWFELQYDIDVTSKRDPAMRQTEKTMEKKMEKKDYGHVDDFINLENDYTIERQKKPLFKIYALGVISAFRHLIKLDPYQGTAGKKMYLVWEQESWFYPSWYHKELVELQKRLREGRPTAYVASEEAKHLTLEETADQIEQLLDIMRPYHERIVVPEWELHSMSPPLATFERLWLLFIPGERVYTKVGGELAGFIVTSTRYVSHDESSRTRNAGKRMMYASIWNYRFVGGKVVRHTSEVSIEEFKDQREITVLPIFPSSVYDKSDDGSLRRKLESRGKKYYELIQNKFAHMEYHGRTLDLKPVEYAGNIIIDPVTYTKLHHFYHPTEHDWEESDVNYDPLIPDRVSEPQDFGGGKLWKDFDDFDPVGHECSLDARHFFLFPKKIFGMSLKDKQWCIFDVDAVKNIDWPAPEDAMKQVILRNEQESLLLANCRDEESVQRSPDWVADPAHQKGAGKLFLLHGPPGTGKTLTVDCIARYLKQPLLSLTVADIGTLKSESNLERWLRLATNWKAIVLIDEADVFMTHRGLSHGQLEDKILVSTFLRTVEYYTGIMFLTTNRPGQMDTALHSRVQFPIEYGELDTDDRKKICKSLFAKFKNTVPKVMYERKLEETLLADEIMDFPLNARELRNAFQLAVALARENSVYVSGGVRHHTDEIKLTLDELRSAFNVREKYNKEMAAIYDMDSASLAKSRGELRKSTPNKKVPEERDDT